MISFLMSICSMLVLRNDFVTLANLRIPLCVHHEVVEIKKRRGKDPSAQSHESAISI